MEDPPPSSTPEKPLHIVFGLEDRIPLGTSLLVGVQLVDSLKAGGELHGVRVLGFFAHVEPEVRERALAAGFDQVVPRSRMHREGPALVAALSRG